jgi:histidinol dehydrogenase
MLRIIDSANHRAVERLIRRHRHVDPALVRRVAGIVARVRRGGDRALVGYARRLDRLAGPVEVSAEEIRAAWGATPREERAALEEAARNVRLVAGRQVPRSWTVRVRPGVEIAQRVTPLARVGCYVPGGRHPLPSSLLMTVIPARAAGVGDVVVACPAPDRTVLAAAHLAGATRVLRLGGAHAIAALAYGTSSIPRVDKIVGPGSAYVAAAKDLVAGDCPIDFRAGPSEIVIVAERDEDPRWIALDLAAQAEHDPDARAILVTPSGRLALAVARALVPLERANATARAALAQNGGAIVTRSMNEAIEIADRAAPEHLVCFDERVAAGVRAGTTFVGPWAAQAAGDYATGSNHVLPTGGAARFRGGLSAADFVRIDTVQRITARGIRRVGPAAVRLAEAEGLQAHAASIAARLEGEVSMKTVQRGESPSYENGILPSFGVHRKERP